MVIDHTRPIAAAGFDTDSVLWGLMRNDVTRVEVRAPNFSLTLTAAEGPAAQRLFPVAEGWQAFSIGRAADTPVAEGGDRVWTYVDAYDATGTLIDEFLTDYTAIFELPTRTTETSAVVTSDPRTSG